MERIFIVVTISRAEVIIARQCSAENCDDYHKYTSVDDVFTARSIVNNLNGHWIMAHAKTNRRKTNQRKTNGGFWTFRYIDKNGDQIDIGGFNTKRACMIDVVVNNHKYPNVDGTIKFVKR